MSDIKELTQNQLEKIEDQLIRLAILYRTSAKIAKSISQDKTLLTMLMKQNKTQLLYGKSKYPVVLSKINGVYKVYCDVQELKTSDEIYYNTTQGFLDNKINEIDDCYKEEDLDLIFHELCELFPEFSSTELLDLYSNQIEKHHAYPIDK